MGNNGQLATKVKAMSENGQTNGINGHGGHGAAVKLTRQDFLTNQEVRWCPGCGDYSILAQVQKVMPELGIDREKIIK